jgi:protein O-GlcNAc transferase
VTAHRFQGHADFCQAYHRADIFLDTPNYCGQNTALFGIWLGVVMLTVAGEIQKHRALASMLLTHGAPHTIARTVQDYEEIAVRLALRPDLLLPLRAYLTQRPLASPLFDVARWVSGLERALSAAWDLYIMPQAGDVKLQGRGEIEPGVAGEQAGHARDFRRHLVLTP